MMTFEEAKQQLESEGYEYLGCADYSDCRTHFWCKPAEEEGWFYVAVVDGWLGNHKPRIDLWGAEHLERLKARLM